MKPKNMEGRNNYGAVVALLFPETARSSGETALLETRQS
jgi:hypothetical protein